MSGGATTAQDRLTEGVQRHYNLDTEFYSLWLDERMTYSCALWKSGAAEGLGEAQVRKLDFILDCLEVSNNGSLLDVGCGWGSLVDRCAERFPDAPRIGLTLSHSQARWARRRARGHQVFMADWRHFTPTHKIDSIACIGALEHFAWPGTSSLDRKHRYQRFFETVAGWSTPSARLVVQSIAVGSSPLTPSARRDARFLLRDIFPGSMPPRLSELDFAADGTWVLVDERQDPDDYAKTCDHWLQRLQLRRSEAELLVGADVTAMYERYLEASASMFRNGQLTLVRRVYRRV